jgi:hypothetical protein
MFAILTALPEGFRLAGLPTTDTLLNEESVNYLTKAIGRSLASECEELIFLWPIDGQAVNSMKSTTDLHHERQQ